MKKFLAIIIIISLSAAMIFIKPAIVHGAARVISDSGGTRNWNDTASWVGGVVPTDDDDVSATGTSGNLIINVATANLNSFNLTGYVGTLSGSSAINIVPIAGAVTCLFAGTNTWTGTLNLNPPAGTTINLTVAGKLASTNNPITETGTTTGTVSLQDALNIGTGVYTFSSGTFTTNNNTVVWGRINAGVGTSSRTFNLGSSDITCSSTGTTTWTVSSSGSTVNAGTSIIRLTGTNADFAGGGGKVYNTVIISGGGTSAMYHATHFTGNLTRTGTAVKTGVLQFITSGVQVDGTFTVTGNSATNRVFVNSYYLTPMTITAAAVSLTNVDFQDIVAAGAAVPFTGASLGNCLGNSNITFTGAVSRYWVASGGTSTGNWSDTNHWSASSGGAGGASVPLAQDVVIFDAGSIDAISRTISSDMLRLGANITWTGVTNSPTWAISTSIKNLMFGNLTLASGMKMTGNSSSYGLSFQGRGAQTITTSGVGYTSLGILNWFIEAPTGSYTLQDDLNFVGTAVQGVWIILNNGTFDANGHNVSINGFLSNGSAACTLNMGNGAWSVNYNGTAAWTATDASLTLNASTSTLTLNNAADTTGMNLGTKTYNNISIVPGAGVTTFSGAFTFANITMASAATTKSVIFTKTTTYTMTGTNFFTGNGTNVITITSNTAGTAFILSKSGGIVSSDYLSLKDSTATGGAGWYAGTHSTSVSGNSGWIFTAPPPPSVFDALLMGGD